MKKRKTIKTKQSVCHQQQVSVFLCLWLDLMMLTWFLCREAHQDCPEQRNDGICQQLLVPISQETPHNNHPEENCFKKRNMNEQR